MRVRLQTSPLGMCFRIIGLLVLGGLAVVVVQQTDWYQAHDPARQQPAATQPAPTPTPSPIPAPAPTAVKAAARIPAARIPAAAPAPVPPGWTDFLGILIPPPGCGETHSCGP